MSETELRDSTTDVEVVATLHELNDQYIRAVVESDTAWFDEHLTDDFVCTLGDGRRIDKQEFLRRTAAGPGLSDLTYDDVDVRLLGDVALVHAVTHFTRDGVPGSRRYTDVWLRRGGCWRAVAAQITPVVP